jgi:hypothetical protein
LGDYFKFKRLDYPETDSPEVSKFVTVRFENGDAKEGDCPLITGFVLPMLLRIKKTMKNIVRSNVVFNNTG